MDMMEDIAKNSMTLLPSTIKAITAEVNHQKTKIYIIFCIKAYNDYEDLYYEYDEYDNAGYDYGYNNDNYDKYYKAFKKTNKHENEEGDHYVDEEQYEGKFEERSGVEYEPKAERKPIGFIRSK